MVDKSVSYTALKVSLIFFPNKHGEVTWKRLPGYPYSVEILNTWKRIPGYPYCVEIQVTWNCLPVYPYCVKILITQKRLPVYPYCVEILVRFISVDTIASLTGSVEYITARSLVVGLGNYRYEAKQCGSMIGLDCCLFFFFYSVWYMMLQPRPGYTVQAEANWINPSFS